MPQLSLYLPEPLLDKLRAAAASEQLTLSSWVTKRLEKELQSSFSPEFAALAGSLAGDDSFGRLEIADTKDLTRESL